MKKKEESKEERKVEYLIRQYKHHLLAQLSKEKGETEPER